VVWPRSFQEKVNSHLRPCWVLVLCQRIQFPQYHSVQPTLVWW
jgi:hypothetical protein